MRPLGLALLGGGPGSFIGEVHRRGAEIDGTMRLVAGVFSRHNTLRDTAASHYGVDLDRSYPDLPSLIAGERAREDGVSVVAIATPNATHFDFARRALEAGLHVVCDKPATSTLREARELQRIVHSSSAHYALTYTYTGYSMIRAARALVLDGALGQIRKVTVDYSQGWLSSPIERDAANKQAHWRADPLQAGVGGCSADIGVHAFQLGEYVSGQRVTELCAHLSSVVSGRELDDDCNLLLRYQNGAVGVLVSSQVATGLRNGLILRVHGELGSISWRHEHADELVLDWAGGTSQILHAGAEHLPAIAVNARRLPQGHPEGFIEAFGIIYRDVATTVRGQGDLIGSLVPGIDEGVRSMAFVEAAIMSSSTGKWIGLCEL